MAVSGNSTIMGDSDHFSSSNGNETPLPPAHVSIKTTATPPPSSSTDQKKQVVIAEGAGAVMDETTLPVTLQNGGGSHFNIKDLINTADLDLSVLENESEERVIGSSADNRFLKYDLEIGRGSFKTVYKGVDTETGVAVAWCELMESKFDKTEQARFKDEVKILKTLNNPYILRLYDSWEYVRPNDKKRVLVLITELMTSGTLKGYMKRLKSIKPRMIRSWGRQILKGLYFLHTRTPPIIHRDLKCDNIFINGTTGMVKIGDLGLATLKKSDVKTVIGTPEFMAPEMYEELYDESVDVYAFGMCLIEMTTREYPYKECQNPAQIFKKVTNGILPQALAKIQDPALKEVIEGCIRGEKNERYTVKDLLDHEFFAEGELKVEIVNDGVIKGDITFRMEVPNRENKKAGQESVEFSYSIHSDIPENVVEEMIKSGILREEDRKNVVRTVREQVGTHKKRLQDQYGNSSLDPSSYPPCSATSNESKVPPDATVSTPPVDNPYDNENNPSKFSRQNSNSSELDSSEALKTHDSTSSTPRESSVPDELLTTPPVSTQSSPALQMKNSTELTIVPEETEDEKSLDSDSEEKRSSVSSKVPPEKEKVGRKESHPLDGSSSDESKGKESKGEDEGIHRGGGGGQGDNEVVSEDNASPKLQETTPPASDSSDSHYPQQPHHDQAVATDHTSATRKKSTRLKESKKLMRLKLTDRYNTGVVGCALCIGEKMVNFKFSTEYDKPREIFQNMLKAAHLTKKDEEEFIKKITEIVDSIKKGECTLPIKDIPEGKERNGTSEHTKGEPVGGGESGIHRNRAGSARQTSKEDSSTSEGGGNQTKDSKSIEDSRSKSDASMPTFLPSSIKTDKKDVATSMSPVSSLDNRPKRKPEITEISKPPVVSQSSSDSMSTLSPVSDQPKDIAGQPEPHANTLPTPLVPNSTESSSAFPSSSKVITLAPSASSSQLYSNSGSSLQGSTTIITTDKKRFEIEDVSFNSEEFGGDTDTGHNGGGVGGGVSTKGGMDSETASQCGGLESASSNSMQSDFHPPHEPAPYLQTDGSNGGGGMHPNMAAANAGPSSVPGSTFSHSNIHNIMPHENKDLYTGIAKFLYLMSGVLKDPDVARLTHNLERQYGPSQASFSFGYGMPPGHHPNHHITTPVPSSMQGGGAGGGPMPPYPSYSGSDFVDGAESDAEYDYYRLQIQKEFEEKERKLKEEREMMLQRSAYLERRGSYIPHNIHPPDSGGSSAAHSNHLLGPSSTGNYQPPPGNAGQLQVVRKQPNEMHHNYPPQIDQREMYHPSSSHSPSRDLTQNPSNQGVGPHSAYPTNVGQSTLSQTGQQLGAGFYQQDRYQPQVQNPSPIPSQSQVSAPPHGYSNYMYYRPPGGFQPPPPTTSNYHSHHNMYPPPPANSSSYQYIGSSTRLPQDLPPAENDHQNSITQKR